MVCERSGVALWIDTVNVEPRMCFFSVTGINKDTTRHLQSG